MLFHRDKTILTKHGTLVEFSKHIRTLSPCNEEWISLVTTEKGAFCTLVIAVNVKFS